MSERRELRDVLAKVERIYKMRLYAIRAAIDAVESADAAIAAEAENSDEAVQIAEDALRHASFLLRQELGETQ